jgi:hypothetical protein
VRASCFQFSDWAIVVAKLRFSPFISRVDQLSVRQGVNETYIVTHECYAKEWDPGNGHNSPWLLPNEWICANLASFLRLDTPAFSVARKGKSAGHPKLFLSSSFSRPRDDPPDLEPKIVWDALPDLCCGILIYDVLIANDDRHPGNIGADCPTKPTTLIVFDHDQALFGSNASRLKSERDNLGMDVHFLQNVVEFREESFKKWIGRVQSIPEWFVKEICQEPVCRKHFTKRLAEDAYDFLMHRMHNMYSIVKNLKGWAPRIRSWPLLG